MVTVKLHSADIENMMESDVKQLASEILDIKGYTVYLIEMEIYGGLCAYAFKNHHYITEDLAIWHKPYKGNTPPYEELRQIYIDSMNNKLYTEQELETVTDYKDLQVKEYFIRNYYGKEINHLSWFGSWHAEGIHKVSPSEQEVEELKEIYTVKNDVAFCYNKPEDADFVLRQRRLLDKLHMAKEVMEQSEEFMYQAFLYEMYNHEYPINWQGDWDVCMCFGNCTYGSDKDYTDYLVEIGKAQFINAYIRAARECNRTMNC